MNQSTSTGYSSTVEFTPGMLTFDQAVSELRRVTTRAALAEILGRNATDKSWLPETTETPTDDGGAKLFFDGELVTAFGPATPIGDNRFSMAFNVPKLSIDQAYRVFVNQGVRIHDWVVAPH